MGNHSHDINESIREFGFALLPPRIERKKKEEQEVKVSSAPEKFAVQCQTCGRMGMMSLEEMQKHQAVHEETLFGVEDRPMGENVEVDGVFPDKDMSAVYRNVLEKYASNPGACPTVYAMNLAEGVSFVKWDRLILLDQSGKLEEVIEEALNAENNAAADVFPGVIPLADAHSVYDLALTACGLLGISCPQIYVGGRTAEDGTFETGFQDLFSPETEALSVSDSSRKTVGILLNEDESVDAQCAALLHELRHAWQHEKHQNRFFSDYRNYNPDSKKYYLQGAEMDANAFAVRVMSEKGYPMYPVDRTEWEDINEQIEAKAKKMCFPHPEVLQSFSKS